MRTECHFPKVEKRATFISRNQSTWSRCHQRSQTLPSNCKQKPVHKCHDQQILEAYLSEADQQDIVVTQRKRVIRLLGSPLRQSCVRLDKQWRAIHKQIVFNAMQHTWREIPDRTAAYRPQTSGKDKRYSRTTITRLLQNVAKKPERKEHIRAAVNIRVQCAGVQVHKQNSL